MSDVIALGPLMVQGFILKWAIAGLFGYNTVVYYAKRRGIWEPAFSDIMIQAIFIVVVAWKVSPLIVNFPDVIVNPVTILIMPGTIEGMWAGLFFAIAYSVVVLRKKKVNLWLFGDVVVLMAVVVVSAYNLLGWRFGLLTDLPWGISIASDAYRYHPVNVYTVLVLFPILVWSFKESKNKCGQGIITPNVLLLSSTGMLLVSLFRPVLHSYYGMSLLQWVYLLTAITGLCLFAIGERRFRGNAKEE